MQIYLSDKVCVHLFITKNTYRQDRLVKVLRFSCAFHKSVFCMSQCSSAAVQEDHMKVVRLWELSGMQISVKSERGSQCTNVLLWIYPGFGKLVKTKKRIFLQRLQVFELGREKLQKPVLSLLILYSPVSYPVSPLLQTSGC